MPKQSAESFNPSSIRLTIDLRDSSARLVDESGRALWTCCLDLSMADRHKTAQSRVTQCTEWMPLDPSPSVT